MAGRIVPIPRGRQRSLLASLLVRPNVVVPSEQLIDWLWDGDTSKDRRSSLYILVSRLRRALGDHGIDLIETRSPGYRINVDLDQIDVWRFESLLDESQHYTDRSAAEAEAERLRRAIALWRGEPLCDVPSESLRQIAVAGLAERRLDAVERRIDVELHLGRHLELVSELRSLTAAEPLRERFWAQLMVVLYRSGRQAEALASYREVRRQFVDTLGVEPCDELRRLEQSVLNGQAELLSASATTPPVHGLGAPWAV